MHAGASTHTSVEKTVNIYFEVNCISYVVTEFLGNHQIRLGRSKSSSNLNFSQQLPQPVVEVESNFGRANSLVRM